MASEIARRPIAVPAPPDAVHLAPRQNLTHRVLANMYHKDGRVDTDTPEMAAARAQISAIQRRHRVKRRHGEELSQTPTMSGLLRQQHPAGAEDGLPPSAQPRESSARDEDDSSQAPQSQLPRRGRVPTPRSPPSRSSSQSRSRPRGRPRLSRNPDDESRGRRGRPRLARNPVGRPSRTSPSNLAASLTSLAHGSRATTKNPHCRQRILR
jgi:hypothetical protein